MRNMICSPFGLSARAAILALAGAFLFAGAPAPSLAKSKPAAKEAPQKEADDGQEKAAEPTDKKGKKNGKDAKGSSKPEQLATFGGWGAYATSGKDKTCYALGAPKERSPKAKLKDTSANVFISTRPGEGVKNEVAINLGYPTKDGSAAKAEIDDDAFELITKGANAWVKNPAEEPKFVKALKEGGKLVVKASSSKGTTTTDTYSLEGLSKALERVAQECK